MQGQLHEELQNAYICLSAGRWKDRAPEANEKVGIKYLCPVCSLLTGCGMAGGAFDAVAASRSDDAR